jgi:hypothetical protein
VISFPCSRCLALTDAVTEAFARDDPLAGGVSAVLDYSYRAEDFRRAYAVLVDHLGTHEFTSTDINRLEQLTSAANLTLAARRPLVGGRAW